ncbi:MAG: alanine racemase [Candidatus Methylomirabilales bacterium]
MARPARAVIHLGAYARNLDRVRSLVGSAVQIMAVVKADAYGHGALPIARIALEAGATWLGVALPEEGAALRQAGIAAPILVLGPTSPPQAPLVLEADLDQMVPDAALAEALADAAKGTRRRARVHLKVETGMGRVGLLPGEVIGLARQLRHLSGIELRGVMTHLAKADASDKTHTLAQVERFRQALAGLEAEGIEVPIRHAANSAAILQVPEAHFDLVRPGIVLYGYLPARQMQRPVEWEPVLELHSVIAQVKRVQPGTTVSYGGTFVATRETSVATIPIGYADGVPRLLSNRGHVLVGGRAAPVIGAVCMDMVMVDVSEVPEAAAGDPVTLIGRQGEMAVWADDWAEWALTISYEVLCGIGPRVPRIHVAP